MRHDQKLERIFNSIQQIRFTLPVNICDIMRRLLDKIISCVYDCAATHCSMIRIRFIKEERE